MSDLSLTREDVERVHAIAQAKEEEWDGDDAAVESMKILTDFCDTLLGDVPLSAFLSGQDMV